MVKVTQVRTIFLLIIVMGIASFTSSCGATGSAGVSYTPPFVPVTFSIDSSGNISVHVAASIVTELGTFSVSGGASASLKADDGTLLVTIRHIQNGSLVDTVYKIQTGQVTVTVVVNGKTTIQITNRSVLIDASQGNIQSIEVKNANSDNTSSTSGDNITPTIGDTATPIPPSPTSIPTPLPYTVS